MTIKAPAPSSGATTRDGPAGTVLATAPDELYLRKRPEAGGPAYVRLRRGDRLVEGDRTVPGPAVDRWRVTAVTPEIVTARHLDTGRSAAWDRRRVEQGLATGSLGTNLGGFESVLVAAGVAGGERVRVVAFGDDGRRYERVYELPTGGEREPRLLRENAAAAGLDRELRAILDEVVGGRSKGGQYRTLEPAVGTRSDTPPETPERFLPVYRCCRASDVRSTG